MSGFFAGCLVAALCYQMASSSLHSNTASYKAHLSSMNKDLQTLLPGGKVPPPSLSLVFAFLILEYFLTFCFKNPTSVWPADAAAAAASPSSLAITSAVSGAKSHWNKNISRLAGYIIGDY